MSNQWRHRLGVADSASSPMLAWLPSNVFLASAMALERLIAKAGGSALNDCTEVSRQSRHAQGAAQGPRSFPSSVGTSEGDDVSANTTKDPDSSADSEVRCDEQDAPGPSCQSKPLTSSVATVIDAARGVMLLDQIVAYYPNAISPEDRQHYRTAFVEVIESELAEDGNAWLRDLCQQAGASTADPERLIVLAMLGAMHVTPHDHTTPAELSENLKKTLRKCDEIAFEPVRSLLQGLLKVEFFDCRFPEREDGQSVKDTPRFLGLLEDYWSIVRTIAFIDAQVYVFQIPHPLLRVLVNLRDRILRCFCELRDVAGASGAKEMAQFVLDALADSETDYFQGCEEEMNRDLTKVDRFIEEAKLTVGHNDSGRTPSEVRFLDTARGIVAMYQKDMREAGERFLRHVDAMPGRSRGSEPGRVATANPPTPPADAPAGPCPLPEVSLFPPQVTIDGKAWALTAEAADLMRALVEADGEWIAASRVVNQASRVRAGMPREAQKWVEASPGKGMRIRRPRA